MTCVGFFSFLSVSNFSDLHFVSCLVGYSSVFSSTSSADFGKIKIFIWSHKHTRTSVTASLPVKTRFATPVSIDSPSAFILFNTIPPCPSQTGEGTAVKEEEWRESTLYEESSDIIH